METRNGFVDDNPTARPVQDEDGLIAALVEDSGLPEHIVRAAVKAQRGPCMCGDPACGETRAYRA